MKNMRNKIDVRRISNKKDYLNWTSKRSYMSRKIFDKNLVAMRKNKVILKLNKLIYVGMSIFDLRNVLMYEFNCDYIKNNMATNQNYCSLILIV